MEKNALAFGYWTERHIENQRRLNLRVAIERAAGDPEKLKDVRGLLAPVLRDTLVGLNYIHYTPPGAQLLLANPVFVRSHDFLGIQGAQQTWRQTEVFGTGWPSSAGGRWSARWRDCLRIGGSRTSWFSREQALGRPGAADDPGQIPRWWRVTPQQMHFVGCTCVTATLLAESVLDPAPQRFWVQSGRRRRRACAVWRICWPRPRARGVEL
jgi:hypothetical protein